MGEPEDGPQSIDRQAAEWVIRLGGASLSEEERRAFTRWLNESPDHALAFEYVHQIWENLGTLREAPDLVAPRKPLAGQAQRDRTHARLARSFSQRTWKAMAACLVLAGVIGILSFDTIHTKFSADYQTAAGEIRTVSLPDGSRVELNTGSAIALNFNDGERGIELLAGEAAFSAAPLTDEESRPFVVRAAGGTTRALGTQFVVHREGNGARVTGIEHQVEVLQDPASTSNPSSVRLSPNQTVQYDAETGIRRVQQADVERTTAWRHGHLVFDRVTVAEAIAEINRYQSGWIMIRDHELAEQRVSGVFRIDDIQAALATIATELHASILSIGPVATLLF
jgi:transmembrane sensor